MDYGVDGVLPWVVLARLPRKEADFLKSALVKEGFEATVVDSADAVLATVLDPRTAIVVFGEGATHDALKSVQNGRRAGPAQWIVYTGADDEDYNMKVLSAGAESVNRFPIRSEDLKARLHEIMGEEKRAWQARVKTWLEVRAKEGGLQYIEPAADFRKRRKWDELAPNVPFDVTSEKVREKIEESLHAVLKCIEKGRISFVGLGSDGHSFSPDPDCFHVMACTADLKQEDLPIETRLYPEVVHSLESHRAVFVPDVSKVKEFKPFMPQLSQLNVKSVAAVPLFKGNAIFGMFKMQFYQAGTDDMRAALCDFFSYSRELTPWARRLEFLTRHSRGHAPKKKKAA